MRETIGRKDIFHEEKMKVRLERICKLSSVILSTAVGKREELVFVDVLMEMLHLRTFYRVIC